MGELITGKFDTETVKRALLTIASAGGNCERAHEALQAQGIAITAKTLRVWRNDRYPQLYRELHDTHGREIEAALVPEMRDLAIAAANAARLAVDKSAQQLAAGEARDPAGTARNLTVTAATAMDKVYLATDRPTSVHEHRDVAEILRSLEKHAARPTTIDGTAQEIPHGPT